MLLVHLMAENAKILFKKTVFFCGRDYVEVKKYSKMRKTIFKNFICGAISWYIVYSWDYSA